MQLIIVRHGESEADLINVIEGRADFSLTEAGHKQAKSLGKWLSENESFQVILSSTLIRAKQTASYIREATDTNIVFHDDLMEWDNGLLAGMDRDEADKKYPIPEGGRQPHHENAETESLINFRARAEMFLSRLVEVYDDKASVCIVSHGGMINMLIQSLLHLPMNADISISCNDTCVHKLTYTKDACWIHYLNNTSHVLSL